MSRRGWNRITRYLHRPSRRLRRDASREQTTVRERAAYPGDFRGEVHPEYAPHPDGVADPGEVVWAWIPYEEDCTRGKDRPAVVIGRDGPWLLALPLTSKDHDRDAAQELAAGRHWRDIGSGAWDTSGRRSEVRLDRVVRLDPAAVRREGSALDRAAFDALAVDVERVRRR